MRQPFGRGVRNSELQGDSSAVARPSIVVHALAVLALGAAIANACSANGSDGASDGVGEAAPPGGHTRRDALRARGNGVADSAESMAHVPRA